MAVGTVGSTGQSSYLAAWARCCCRRRSGTVVPLLSDADVQWRVVREVSYSMHTDPFVLVKPVVERMPQSVVVVGDRLHCQRTVLGWLIRMSRSTSGPW